MTSIRRARGSRAGMWIALVSLLVIGAAAGAVYMFVFKRQERAGRAADACRCARSRAVAMRRPSSSRRSMHTEAPSPLDAARAELLAGV